MIERPAPSCSSAEIKRKVEEAAKILHRFDPESGANLAAGAAVAVARR